MKTYTEKMLDKYRDWNVEGSDWAEGVIEAFKERMIADGVDVDEVYWTGFAGQGIGACFEGSLDNPVEFFDRHLHDQFPIVRKMLKENSDAVSWSCEHKGRYYHENSIHVSFDMLSPSEVFSYTGDMVNDAMLDRMDTVVDGYGDAVEEAITETMQGFMQELYSEIEKEFDYLTSDEAITESLEANDIEEEFPDDA